MALPSPPRHADVITVGRLAAAWDHVLRKNSAAGVDGVTVSAWAAGAGERLPALAAELAGGTWRPRPARRLVLDDLPERPLAIPCVEDRVVQRAIALAIGPWSESRLAPSVWAYRKGRGVSRALDHAGRQVALGRRWVVRADIESFFDRVDRGLLAAALTADGFEPETVALIGAIVEAGVAHGANVTVDDLGVVQGSALSPLLANLYLRSVDAALDALGEERGFAYLRYSDDFCILGRNEGALNDALHALADGLAALGLRLSARKTRRGHVGAGVEWLGARFDASGRRPARRMLEAFAERAGALTAAGDLEGLAELHATWRRSYGALHLDDIATGPMLAARVVETAGRAEAATLARCEELREAVGGDWAEHPAVHVALVEAWREAGLLAGVLLDARAAVRGLSGRKKGRERGSSGGLTERLAAAVGLAPGELARLARPWGELPDALGQAGLTELAAAARAVARRRSEGVVADREGATAAAVAGVDLEAGAAAAWAASFAGRVDRHLVELEDGRGHRRLVGRQQALDGEAVRAHLAGRSTRGVYLVDGSGAVVATCLDVRLAREAALGGRGGDGGWGLGPKQRLALLGGLVHDHAVALVRAAERRGVAVVMEATGARARRLWVRFEERVPMRHARGLWLRVEDDVGPAPEEVRRFRYPNTDALGAGAGPTLMLPLGGRRGGERAVVVDRRGEVVVDALGAFARAERLGARALRAIIFGPSGGPLAEAQKRKAAAWAKLPHTAQVMARCGVLRGLAEKAQVFGRLEGEERQSVVQGLAGLPEAERVAGVLAVLAPTGEREWGVRKRVKGAGRYPASCARLRARHGVLAKEVGCDCVFSGLRAGAYPTPVLHTLRVHQVAAFGRTGRGGGGREAVKRGEGGEGSSRAEVVKGPGGGADGGRRAPPRPPPSAASPSAASPPGRPAEVARPPKGPERVAASARPAEPAADGGLAQEVLERFVGAVERIQRLRLAVENAQRGLARSEAALDELFGELGVDRVRLPQGWLVRRRDAEGGVRFVIEL